jgi:hypothetical protein
LRHGKKITAGCCRLRLSRPCRRTIVNRREDIHGAGAARGRPAPFRRPPHTGP